MAAAADCSGVCIDAEINGSTPQSDIRPLSGVPGRLPAGTRIYIVILLCIVYEIQVILYYRR